ncbi:MAG: MFS transporter [Solirubrobacteraceae bacterium]
MKPVLRIPAYRRLVAAYTLNELAFMVSSVALTLLIYGRTGSAFGATAFFLCSQFVPALLSPMLVARLDQLPPRPTLPALYWLETAIFIVLAALSGHRFMLVPVLALTLLNGVIAFAARSLGRAATVTVTSAKGLLREGNALANAGFSMAFLIGPGIGGAVVAAGGTSEALLGIAVLFGVIGLTLATAHDLPQPSPARAPARGRVRAAVAYVRERPTLRALMLVQASGILFFTISVPVEVVFVRHSLGASPAAYGALVSAWGAGAMAGAAIYARYNRLPSRSLMALGAGSLGLGFLVMSAAPTLAVAIVGGALAGVGNGVESVAGRTAVQELTETSWMALMMSLQESLFQSVPGAGILIGGTITALGSPRTALAVAGVGSLAVTAAIWVVLRNLASGPVPAAEPATNGSDPAAVPVVTDPEMAPDGADLVGTRREEARTAAVRHQ